MATIHISVVFSEDCYIAKKDYKDLPYNCKVSGDKNMLVCYKRDCDNDWQKVFGDDQVNKDQRGFFKRLFGSKYDPNDYTFYVIDKAPQNGKLFGSITAKSRPTNQSKVQWRVQYSFQAVSPNIVIKNIVKNSPDEVISREEVRKVIKAKLESTISNAIAKAIDEQGKSGLERFDTYKDECAKAINELPEMKAKNELGLIVKIESIEIDLEEVVKETQKSVEMNEYIHSHKKEDN